MSVDAMIQQLVQQQVQALIPQIVQAVQSQVGGMQNQQGIGLTAQQPAQQMQAQQPAQQMQAQQPADAFGGLAGAQQAVTVTPELIQSVVSPLTQNEATKAQCIAHMQAMGLNGLGDCRPDQMAELYARFCSVRDGTQYGGSAMQAQQPAQQMQAQQPAAGGTTII
jgi:hypothetical protein